MNTRYDGVSQALHWATALLVLVAFIYSPGGSEARIYAPSRDFERQLHETLGLFVFALLAIRMLWRFLETRPAPLPLARWMDLTARVVQTTLYLLLFAVPCTAIAGAWLEGHPLTLMAGITIPPPLMTSHRAGMTMAALHKWLGDAMMGLAAFHALAALYHHFILQDTALASMLPRWFPLLSSSKNTR